jgi:predicted protein tyrosine phosphatase
MEKLCDVLISSKKEFERNLSHLDDIKVEKCTGSAFISILCPKIKEINDSLPDIFSDNEHFFKENHSNVLNIDFWDIDEEINTNKGKLLPFTLEQAREIINFIENNHHKDFYIHCHAGISRSAAVGYFIRDYYDWIDKERFDKLYSGTKSPNVCVYSLLKKAYEEKHY